MNAQTIFGQFVQKARLHPERPFLNIVPNAAQIYSIPAGELAYGDLLSKIEAKRDEYKQEGYGNGHRVGLLLENRPAFFIHWFALNALGVSVVPINPDLRSAELAYLLGHSEQCLAVSIESRIGALRDIGDGLAVIGPEDGIPPVSRPAPGNTHDEAALLYTSGTTGVPKGCVLSNHYFLNCGDWYNSLGGYCTLQSEGERMLTPLPLFHMNAMACSVMAMISVGGSLAVLDRFHPSTWWDDVAAAKATAVHYLGVMPAMLMSLPRDSRDTRHSIKFGFGAGVDRSLHAPFEERFGFPLIEAWAMTETGNGAVVAAFEEPRHVGTNCFGRPQKEVEIRIEDDAGKIAKPGTAGELLVRHQGVDPGFGFFDRYLKDDAATADAWRGGWFHTGDIVRGNLDGTLVFVDRKKNVIRRSGENISAVEVESVLGQHSRVHSVAVAAVEDPVRGDEVFACIIVDGENGDMVLAEDLTAWCLQRLAYFKAPGFLAFVDALPLTSTNKINRGKMAELAGATLKSGQFFDLRHLKKRAVV
jgi:acyl-CoA synthetase (AMP-forming)/AMP-acid ligase II